MKARRPQQDRRDRRMSPAKRQKGREELVVTRIFDAPRERVWKAWTEPELLKRWWGPTVFTAPFIEIDLRVGGRYLYAMRSPEGKDFWSTGVYREIVPLKRIVATDSFSDEKGNIVPASSYGFAGDWPRELLVTVTFEEQDGGTKLTLLHTGFPLEEDRVLAKAGWSESLDKLAGVLKRPGEGEMRMQKTHFTVKREELKVILDRVFDAPREAVWKVLTDPKSIPKWWGPRNMTTTVDKMDVRAGGAWRYINRDDAGNEYVFHGVYREIDPPKRISDTFNFEGIPPGHELVESLTLEDLDGRTKMTTVSRYANVEDLDGMVASGMESGAVDSWERLAELVEKRT
jgi:uncharacterized protein YndB with AHSA1/START domain